MGYIGKALLILTILFQINLHNTASACPTEADAATTAANNANQQASSVPAHIMPAKDNGSDNAMLCAPRAKCKFAAVPKSTNNPIFDLIGKGCNIKAKITGVECVFKGPTVYEPSEQAKIVRDFIASKADGIAIAVSDAEALSGAIKEAVSAGIPVVTFDSDAPNSQRTAFISTNDLEFGRMLGEQLAKLRKSGGTYAMISGGAGSRNLRDRADGVRQALDDAHKAGQTGKWVELSSSPAFSDDDMYLAVVKMNDLKTSQPDLTAIVALGGWPMYASEAYKKFVKAHKQALDSGEFTLVVADALEVQLKLLKDGFASALIGQRPVEIGETIIETLIKLKKSEQVPQFINVGVDVITKDNVDDFLKRAASYNKK